MYEFNRVARAKITTHYVYGAQELKWVAEGDRNSSLKTHRDSVVRRIARMSDLPSAVIHELESGRMHRDHSRGYHHVDNVAITTKEEPNLIGPK